MTSNGLVDPTFGTAGYNQNYTSLDEVPYSAQRLLLPGNGYLYHVGSKYAYSGIDQNVLRLNASSGALDTTFGTGGRIGISFVASGVAQRIAAAALTPDGGVVFAGSSAGEYNSQMTIGRIDWSGQPVTFESSGTSTIEINFGTFVSTAFDIRVLDNGKILVAGEADTYDGSYNNDYALARLNADGSLDTTFGVGGKTVTEFDVEVEQITRIFVASDGSIYASGKHIVYPADRRAVILHYSASGVLDTDFGDGGRLFLDVPNDNTIQQMTVYDDGSMLLGGQTDGTSTDAFIARLLPGGTLDTTFASGGVLYLGLAAVTTTMKLVDDGSRLFAAVFDNTSTLRLIRLMPDGTYDTTFGSGGTVTYANSGFGSLTDLEFTPQGQWLVYGKRNTSDIEVRAFSLDGSVDTSFGTGGSGLYSFGTSDDTADMLPLPDGSWIITGTGGHVGTQGDFTAIRIKGWPEDLTPPQYAASLVPNAPPQVRLQFNERLSQISAGDFYLTRAGNPARIAVQPDWLTYDRYTNRATIRPQPSLADGNYSLVVHGSITDLSGNSLGGDSSYDFFILGGDANRDRRVDQTDLGILSTNWNTTGKTFSQGDFNYDGRVDIADFKIFTGNWGKILAAPGPAPATPTALSASLSGQQVNLTWIDQSSNEIGFVIERKTGAAGAWEQLAQVGAGVQGYADPTVVGGNSYTYRVFAITSDNSSGYSNEATAAIPQPAPAAPSNLIATLNGSNVDLSWSDASDNETGFTIQRKTGAAGTWGQLDQVGAGVTSYSDTTVVAGNTYFYRVYAYNAGGNSANSNEASAAYPSPVVTTYLSDLTWTAMTNGWGSVEKDKSNGEQATGDGRTITLNGVTYTKGLGTHAGSSITYALNGNYTTFLSDIGVDDEVGNAGSVVFQVYLDNVLSYTSSTLTGSSATQQVNLNITGKTTLRLVVTDAGNGATSDHAEWANARLLSGGTSLPSMPISDPTPPPPSSSARRTSSRARMISLVQ
jgi:uncharacterized delta-60 repeat protein